MPATYCRNANKVQTKTELNEWEQADQQRIHFPEYEFVVSVLIDDDDERPWNNGWTEVARFTNKEEAIERVANLSEFGEAMWEEQETTDSEYGRHVKEELDRRW